MSAQKKTALIGLGIALISLVMPWAYYSSGDMSIPYYTAVYSTALTAFSPLVCAGVTLSFAGGFRQSTPRRAAITAVILCGLSGLLMAFFAVMFLTQDWTPVGFCLQVVSLCLFIYSGIRAIRSGVRVTGEFDAVASHA